MNRGSYWLTIAQAALELKMSTADVRRLVRKGQLAAMRVEPVGVEVVSRDSIEHVKLQLRANDTIG